MKQLWGLKIKNIVKRLLLIHSLKKNPPIKIPRSAPEKLTKMIIIIIITEKPLLVNEKERCN